MAKPVIVRPRNRRSDIVEEACEALRNAMLNRKTGKPGLSPSFLERETGISKSTLYNMRDRQGDDSYSPHLKTIQFLASGVGYRLTLTKE